MKPAIKDELLDKLVANHDPPDDLMGPYGLGMPPRSLRFEHRRRLPRFCRRLPPNHDVTMKSTDDLVHRSMAPFAGRDSVRVYRGTGI